MRTSFVLCVGLGSLWLSGAVQAGPRQNLNAQESQVLKDIQLHQQRFPAHHGKFQRGFQSVLRSAEQVITTGTATSTVANYAILGVPQLTVAKNAGPMKLQWEVRAGRPCKVDSSKKGSPSMAYTRQHVYSDGSSRTFTRSTQQLGNGLQVEHAFFFPTAAPTPGHARGAALVAPGGSRYYLVTPAHLSPTGKTVRVDITHLQGKVR